MTLASCPLLLQSLVKQPFSRRRQLLHELFVETEGEFLFATSMDTCNTDEISEFLDQSIKGKLAPSTYLVAWFGVGGKVDRNSVFSD